MSLRDAVQVISDEMDKEYQRLREETSPSEALYLLHSFATQLRISLKATEGEAAPIPRELLVPAELQHRSHIDQEREKLRRERGGEDCPGEEGLRVVSVFGGPAAGNDGVPTVISISDKMPLRAKTEIAGGVYQLREDGLHYLPEGKS